MATEEDKTNSGALATLVAVLALAVVGVSLAVTALTRDELANVRAQKEGPAGQRFLELKRGQLEKLAAGKPIEQAMQEVVEGLKRDPESATPPSSGKAAPGASASAAPAPGENAPTGNAAAMPESAAPGASGAAPAGSAAPAAPSGSAAAAPAADASAKAANDAANGKETPKSGAVPSGSAAPKPVAPPAGPGKPQSAPAPASAP